MLGSIGKIIGQIQQLQEELKNIKIEGSAGSGAVRVEVNGQQEVLAVHLDQEAMKTIEPAQLETLVKEAFTAARKNSKEKAKSEVAKVTGLDLSSIPGMF